MQESSLIILYLLSFRLSVIFVGLAAIVLGYKLFSKGIDNQAKGKESITAEIGDNKLEFINIAPGTGFAMFGAVLIIVMLVKAPPQVQLEKDSAQFRGQAPISNSFQAHPRCQWEINENTHSSDIEACWNAMSVPLNNHAWYLHQQNANPQLALKLASLAVTAHSERTLTSKLNQTLSNIQSRHISQPTEK